jgi:polyphosphate glucokinase
VRNIAAKNVLVIDVGGTHVKVLAAGQAEHRQFGSGRKLTPELMFAGVKRLVSDWQYDEVAIGYPGPVLNGKPVAEPRNLGTGWVGFDFAGAFGCPVKVINDAAMQALGSYRGGKMLFLGFGTGLGSTMIVDGIVEPMELAHLPYKKSTFEDYVGARALEKHGRRKWRRYVADVIARLIAALEPDDVVLGGGNAKYLKELPERCRLGDNSNAFAGGFRLWGLETGGATFPTKQASVVGGGDLKETSMTAPALTDRTIWKALEAHAKSLQGHHLRTLFATDPQRGERLTAEAAGLFFDYSKQRLNDETIRLLVELAVEADLRGRIDSMFRGDKINVTENRAVLHIALRAPRDATIEVDGVNVVPEVHAVLDRMAEFSGRVRSGDWKGHTGQAIRNVVNIGIGGSDLGPVMAYEALRHDSDRGLTFRFVSNVDGYYARNHDERPFCPGLVARWPGQRRAGRGEAFRRRLDELGEGGRVRHRYSKHV